MWYASLLHAEANDFRINFRAAFLRVFVLFQYDHACTVAQHKAITLFIPRTACRLRIVVTRGQRACGTKATYAQRGTGFFCATGNHGIRIAISDNARSLGRCCAHRKYMRLR
ncbi:Uncharacterised protein [Kluyvera cryocrescens]|uniref:Uncharacterized protein n=1 Tax=Kluyvera cryocrescens TaxID=580 RepID=A0A485C9B6_KLUCR|nr:Uncharacterised protein [Kluyvera cryocrescens]